MISPYSEAPPCLVGEWIGLYKESWTGIIHPSAFAHPAKFSRALIRAIYLHCSEMGWIRPGDSVVDPFGGVALGGFDALQLGLHWTGCELEEKFVGLGNQNIALWNERFSRMPNWGSARLVQGDSRKLLSVLDRARLTVSSPPYAEGLGHGGAPTRGADRSDDCNLDAMQNGYGASEGQLGAMKEGEHSLAVSSPPYINSVNAGDHGIDWTKVDPKSTGGRKRGEDSKHGQTLREHLSYTENPDSANLGAMVPGDFSAAITSPPYASGEKGHPSLGSVNNDDWGNDGRDITRRRGKTGEYGETDGQLASMPNGDHTIVVSSPPFPQPYTGGGGINVKGYQNDKQRPGSGDRPFDLVGERTYQGKGGDRAEGNLETMDADGFEAAVTSPPYEGNTKSDYLMSEDNKTRARDERRGFKQGAGCFRGSEGAYGQSDGQLGTERGEDFWSASRLILEQLYQVIAPGGHAVFVVKAFVRNKKIVDFPGQWVQLCEAVGFRLLHDHHALLTEHYGTQQTMHGEDKELTVARKSFFRRLAESKGSPKIDYENVLCFEKPQ